MKYPVLFESNFVGRWLVQMLQMLGAHDDDGGVLVRMIPFLPLLLVYIFFHAPVSGGALPCTFACFLLHRVSRDVPVLVP